MTLKQFCICIYIYIYLWSKTALMYSRTLQERFTWAFQQCFQVFKKYFWFNVVVIFFWGFATFFIPKLGSFSIWCLVIRLSCTAVIWIFSYFMVGNIFRHMLHAICSLVIWYFNLLLSSSFSLQLSHLYTFFPFTMWNFLSWFNRLDVLLSSLLQISHFKSVFNKTLYEWKQPGCKEALSGS